MAAWQMFLPPNSDDTADEEETRLGTLKVYDSSGLWWYMPIIRKGEREGRLGEAAVLAKRLPSIPESLGDILSTT